MALMIVVTILIENLIILIELNFLKLIIIINIDSFSFILFTKYIYYTKNNEKK